MPLKKGSGKSTIGQNISEMMKSGHGQKQSVAAALHAAGKGRKGKQGKRGGKKK